MGILSPCLRGEERAFGHLLGNPGIDNKYITVEELHEASSQFTVNNDRTNISQDEVINVLWTQVIRSR